MNPQKSISRLSKQKIVINEWKARLRDFEIYVFFFIILWYMSLGLDKIKGLHQNEFPLTQWPRKFFPNKFIYCIHYSFGFFRLIFMFN